MHFKSRDLARLQAQGQFWHIFFTTGAAIISQDEIDTWTCHYPVSLDQDTTKLDPTEVIYAVLGGSAGRYPIEVDKILVTSVFRPNLVVANEYISPHQRVFLAGDSGTLLSMSNLTRFAFQSLFSPDLSFIDIRSSPEYSYRRIWYEHGCWRCV